jgi:hypothetical protein
MQSGDPLRVKAALVSAAKTLLEAHAQLTQQAAVRSPDLTLTPIKSYPNPIFNPTPIVNPIGGGGIPVGDDLAMPPGELGGGVESELVVGHLTQSFAR